MILPFCPYLLSDPPHSYLNSGHKRYFICAKPWHLDDHSLRKNFLCPIIIFLVSAEIVSSEKKRKTKYIHT